MRKTRTPFAVSAALGLLAVLALTASPAAADRSAEDLARTETVATEAPLAHRWVLKPERFVANHCMVVPDVIGMTVPEATAAVAAASPWFYSIVDAGGVPEGEAEIGTIFFQWPDPGTKIYTCDHTAVSMTQVGFYIPE